jgi:hypothetical protein
MKNGRDAINSWINKERPVRWVYDYELAGRDQRNDLIMLTSGVFPLLLHRGDLLLTESGIELYDKSGTLREELPFDNMETVFMGYDDLYPSRLSKNFGYGWAPIRITLTNNAQIYLIIYRRMGLITSNKAWFEKLRQMLAAGNE